MINDYYCQFNVILPLTAAAQQQTYYDENKVHMDLDSPVDDNNPTASLLE